MAARGTGTLKLASRAFVARRPCPPALTTQRRTFLDSVFPPNKPLTINVSRTLPYPREKLYDMIADVDAYSSFLPYCQHSRVTKWSKPDGAGRAWPTEGDLTVGFGPITQSYTSRIVCVPGRSIEALSGRQEGIPGPAGSPFESLVTKWTVQDAIVKRIGTWSTVDLDLTMRLADPLVQMMLSKVVDETATKMIDAFEQRARDLFGDMEG